MNTAIQNMRNLINGVLAGASTLNASTQEMSAMAEQVAAQTQIRQHGGSRRSTAE